MKEVFTNISAYLQSSLTAYGVTYVRMWNNQLADIKDGTFTAQTALYNNTQATPIVLVEFVSPMTINTLGNGDQFYEDLTINLHLIYDFTDSQDGTMDQDLLVLDFAQAVYFALQDYMPNIPIGAMYRVAEQHDFDHSNLYHFIQTYKTNFVDSIRNRPISGVLSDPNDTLQTIINTTN